MARNEEKAQQMLNKWVTMKQEFNAGNIAERRPFLATDCKSLADCEKWRLQIMREITRNVASIQNQGLGEHKIRDLNDTINKLLREKGHWQFRIRDLGGPDYNALEPKATAKWYATEKTDGERHWLFHDGADGCWLLRRDLSRRFGDELGDLSDEALAGDQLDEDLASLVAELDAPLPRAAAHPGVG